MGKLLTLPKELVIRISMDAILDCITSKWNLRYSKYVGELILFVDGVNELDVEYKVLDKGVIVGVDVSRNKPVYLEIKDASDYIEGDIGKMEIPEIVEALRTALERKDSNELQKLGGENE